MKFQDRKTGRQEREGKKIPKTDRLWDAVLPVTISKVLLAGLPQVLL